MTGRRGTASKRTLRRLVRLVEVQGNLCGGCGKLMLGIDTRRSRRDDAPTVDHTICKAHHGADAFGNIVAMHRACNNAKGDDRPTGCEWVWLLAVNCRIGALPQMGIPQ